MLFFGKRRRVRVKFADASSDVEIRSPIAACGGRDTSLLRSVEEPRAAEN